MEMTMNQLVELTGKTFRTIKKRLEPLAPVREAGNASYYNTKDALALLYPTIASEMAQENLMLERARREKAQIEVGKMRGELIPVGDIAKVLGTQFGFLRAQIRSIPSKSAKPLSMISDPHEVYNRLTEMVDECLSELTADAKYKLEQDRILISSRTDLLPGDVDGLEAEPETEPSSMG